MKDLLNMFENNFDLDKRIGSGNFRTSDPYHVELPTLHVTLSFGSLTKLCKFIDVSESYLRYKLKKNPPGEFFTYTTQKHGDVRIKYSTKKK